MNPSQGSQSRTKPVERNRRKRFRIEFGATQLLLFSFTFFVVLAWMFVFGILVGRGLPLVESADTSLRAQLLRFIGLGEETTPLATEAAETWENPRKMVESLNYYDSLTKKADPISGKPLIKAAIPSAQPQNTPAASTSSPKEKTTGSEAADVSAQENSQENKVTENATTRFTLLAASLKDSANAERFVKKLQAKGYSPRMETVEMAESGRWTRVLVGAFDSREEALKFAAEFNRKENMQGLVVRLGR